MRLFRATIYTYTKYSSYISILQIEELFDYSSRENIHHYPNKTI